ncbi:MAG TPA: hypothetical protein VGB55_12190 [Tepidisphaeraceae bacterium]|jgi:DNA-binding response OmpR family regulator
MVVVLDPNDVVAQDLRESFHAGGLETLGFTDLLAAGDYMRYKKPDLLVIDPDVADVDGGQLIQFLSKHYGAGLVPMIVQCSDAHPRIAEAVRRLDRGVLVHKGDLDGPQLLSIARQLLAHS